MVVIVPRISSCSAETTSNDQQPQVFVVLFERPNSPAHHQPIATFRVEEYRMWTLGRTCVVKINSVYAASLKKLQGQWFDSLLDAARALTVVRNARVRPFDRAFDRSSPNAQDFGSALHLTWASMRLYVRGNIPDVILQVPQAVPRWAPTPSGTESMSDGPLATAHTTTYLESYAGDVRVPGGRWVELMLAQPFVLPYDLPPTHACTHPPAVLVPRPKLPPVMPSFAPPAVHRQQPMPQMHHRISIQQSHTADENVPPQQSGNRPELDVAIKRRKNDETETSLYPYIEEVAQSMGVDHASLRQLMQLSMARLELASFAPAMRAQHLALQQSLGLREHRDLELLVSLLESSVSDQ